MNHHHKHSAAWGKYNNQINSNLHVHKTNFSKEYKLIGILYLSILNLSLTSLFLPFFLLYQLIIILVLSVIYFILWFSSDNLFSRNDKTINNISEIYESHHNKFLWILVLIFFLSDLLYLIPRFLFSHSKQPIFTRNTLVVLLIFFAILRLFGILTIYNL